MKNFDNMSELASELGLSRSTVSYILCGKWQERKISPKTARRVLDYVQEVKFTPNLFGRAIRGKITTDVAILLPHNAYEHHKQVFFEFIRFVSENNLSYLVFPLKNGEDNQETLSKLKLYKVRRVLVISTPIATTKENLAWWTQAVKSTPDMKWFFYDCSFPEHWKAYTAENVYCTSFNREQAAMSVIDHISSCRYKKLLCCGFTLNDRIRQYITSRSMELLDMIRFPVNDDLFSAGIQCGKRIEKMDFPRRESAIFVFDDTCAIGLIHYLREHHYSIPGDYNVISWDGLEISKYITPPLTTLVVPIAAMLNDVQEFITDKLTEHICFHKSILQKGGTLGSCPQK